MSTRAQVILKEQNKLQIIGVWNDGYTSHTGKMLFNHFNTKEKVQELIDLGSVGYLGKTIQNTSKNYNEWAEKGYIETIVRHRDYKRFYNWQPRFEDEQKMIVEVDAGLEIFDCETIYNIAAMEDCRVWTDPNYIYLFDADTNKWHVVSWGENFQELKDVLIDDEENAA